jgi:hypothetical protein
MYFVFHKKLVVMFYGLSRLQKTDGSLKALEEQALRAVFRALDQG